MRLGTDFGSLWGHFRTKIDQGQLNQQIELIGKVNFRELIYTYVYIPQTPQVAPKDGAPHPLPYQCYFSKSKNTYNNNQKIDYLSHKGASCGFWRLQGVGFGADMYPGREIAQS